MIIVPEEAEIIKRDCDDIYRRVYWNIHGRKEFVWRCFIRIEQSSYTCKNKTLKQGYLYDTVIGDTTEFKISEISTLLEEKYKESISLANKGKDF